MQNELSQTDVLEWSAERHRRRFDPVSREYTPVVLGTPQEERQEYACCILEIDAWIAEYRQWLDELVPGSSFAERKQPIYWDAITRLEQRKRYFLNHLTLLDSFIAKPPTDH